MIYAENILLCIAVPLIVSLLFVRGEVRRYLAAFLLGMLVCLLAAYISGFLNLVTGMGENETAIFVSPMVEELMKLLPLLFFLVLLTPEDRTLAMLAVAIGAGFATFENCCYLLATGSESLTFTLVRGLAVGVMHIACMLAITLSLIMVRRHRVFTFSTVVGSLSLSVVFHALYNLLVSVPGLPSSVGYALPLMMALILYWPYRKLREACT